MVLVRSEECEILLTGADGQRDGVGDALQGGGWGGFGVFTFARPLECQDGAPGRNRTLSMSDWAMEATFATAGR